LKKTRKAKATVRIHIIRKSSSDNISDFPNIDLILFQKLGILTPSGTKKITQIVYRFLAHLSNKKGNNI
jgi:hypothetical protein